MRSFNFKKVCAYLLTALLVFSVGFGFTGCKVDDDDNLSSGVAFLDEKSSLVGTWNSSYGEIFKITKSSLSNGGSWGDCYAGNELCVKKLSDTAGYIYIKYTRSANADYTYSETAPDVGKWYAIHYKNLSSSAVELSGAFKAAASGGVTSTATLEEAIKEFTIANGYFASYSACEKQ